MSYHIISYHIILYIYIHMYVRYEYTTVHSVLIYSVLLVLLHHIGIAVQLHYDLLRYSTLALSQKNMFYYTTSCTT